MSTVENLMDEEDTNYNFKQTIATQKSYTPPSLDWDDFSISASLDMDSSLVVNCDGSNVTETSSIYTLDEQAATKKKRKRKGFFRKISKFLRRKRETRNEKRESIEVESWIEENIVSPSCKPPCQIVTNLEVAKEISSQTKMLHEKALSIANSISSSNSQSSSHSSSSSSKLNLAHNAVHNIVDEMGFQNIQQVTRIVDSLLQMDIKLRGPLACMLITLTQKLDDFWTNYIPVTDSIFSTLKVVKVEDDVTRFERLIELLEQLDFHGRVDGEILSALLLLTLTLDDFWNWNF